ncbi:MAG: hypothetical protein ACOZIN_06200 [Myxococcota bacterium]
MKAKVSVTIESPLVEFLDQLPGETRSEKLERILLKFKRFEDDQRLRHALSAVREEDRERTERESWERTMAEAMWSE